jgi:hypothetical protein
VCSSTRSIIRSSIKPWLYIKGEPASRRDRLFGTDFRELTPELTATVRSGNGLAAMKVPLFYVITLSNRFRNGALCRA